MVTFSTQITPGGQRLLIIYITQHNLLGKGWAKNVLLAKVPQNLYR